MSDTSNTSGNNPSTNPITLANKFQDSFFPFSAFTFDDPNTSSVPNLNLTPPWQFSAASKANVLELTLSSSAVTLSVSDISNYDVIILSGAITANITVTLPKIARKYDVVIACTTSTATVYNITITTGATGGKTAVVPALNTYETVYGTYYTITIISTGTNIYFNREGVIAGRTSTSNGYLKYMNGMLINYVNDTVTDDITSGPIDGDYFGEGTWTFPCAFASTTYAFGGIVRISGKIVLLSGAPEYSTVNSAYLLYTVRGGYSLTGATIYRALYAIGRWK